MSSNFSILNIEVSTSPIITSSTIVRSPRHNGRRNRSEAWNHFNQLEPKSNKRAQCKYYDVVINYENGTSSRLGHVSRCLNNPNKEAIKRQKTSSSSTNDGIISSHSYNKFDQDFCEMEMVKLFVEFELPFRLVEHPTFRRYSYTLQPKFNIRSHYTLSHKIVILWNTMKEKLKFFLSKHCQRVCLAIDAWTSPQNASYMCLTAHFIDNDWKLHQKILNFRQERSYMGEAMTKFVESCLNELGLNHVLSFTVDNAASNNT